MNQEEINSCKELHNDIDACITALIKARTEHNQEDEGKALFRMEGLMVAAQQQLAYFIDKPVPSDVQEDKAAMDYYLNLPNSSYGDGGNLLPRSINDAFKAGAAWQAVKDGECHEESFEEGAKWQRERLMKDAREHLPKGCETLADTVGFAEGVKLGRRLERQDLMKEAIDAQVMIPIPSTAYIKEQNLHDLRKYIVDNFKHGDKVSVIIIKKEK